MCGICGVIDWTASADAAGIVRRMTPTMHHRGPDDQGIVDFEFRISELEKHYRRDTEHGRISEFGIRNADLETQDEAEAEARNYVTSRDGALSIGMTRLSIIDIDGGHQPVFNEDGSVGAVLNGEIYNFQELRQQLEDCGHTFRTRSDSEVVVHAYEEWGAECVERFEGMFAIAVWDGGESRRQKAVGSGQNAKAKQRAESEKEKAGEGARGPSEEGSLFLARDRLGIKPLYYFAQGAEFRVSDVEFRVPSFEFGVKDEIQNSKTETRIAELETRNAKLETNTLEPETRNSKLETFVFASEVRTLLASGAVPRRLSRAALESYLLFGSVSEPMTLIEGVLSIPPGHRMTIDLGDATAPVRPEAYWNIADARHGDAEMGRYGEGETGRRGDGQTPGREDTETGRGADSQLNGHRSKNSDVAHAAQQVRELLTDSVRKHLIADVPVGVFLSSGIDSTALAALASREAAGVHTFTVAFPEKEFSEAEIARRTAATFGTTHQELMLSGDEMLARLSEAVAALDQPSMDGINTYFVSWGAAQAGLKVALSGLGGDEVFGGYNTFHRTAHFQRLSVIGDNMPRSVRTAVTTAVAAAGGRFIPADVARKLGAVWNNGESMPDAFYFGRTLFTPSQVTKLLTGHKSNGARSPWRNWLAETALQARKLDGFGAVTCMEARSYLVNTLLRDTDSMSMAHSLEVRVPFLDHPLVEYVTHLPAETKLQKGIPKALLVAALSDLLPTDVVGQKKRGFTFPWAAWLRGPLKAKVESGLSELSPALREALDAKETRRVWQDYLDGKTSWSRPWSLYVLNEWAKKHLG